MLRSGLILLSGAVAGAAVIYISIVNPVFVIDSDDPGSARDWFHAASDTAADSHFPPQDRDIQSLLSGPDGAAPGSAVSDAYETAAAIANARTLETLIAQAADRPAGWGRDVELKALLGRLSEIDARAAVVLAVSLGLEPQLLVPLFQGLAVADPAAALGELSSVAHIGLRRTLAQSLLDVVGSDAAGTTLIASAFPETERMGFRLDAIVAQGLRDPSGAVRAALEVRESMGRTYVLATLVDSLAVTDPHAALAIAAEVSHEFPVPPNAHVLDSWAFSDPDAAFSYLEAAERADLQGLGNVFTTLAAYDRERLLDLVDQLPPAQQRVARRAALEVLARHEPYSALAELERLPAGRDQQMLLATVARSFARHDTAGALAWARSDSELALDTVIRTVALSDPDYALRMALDESMLRQTSDHSDVESGIDRGARLALSIAAASGAADVGYLADQLLRSGAPGVQPVVESMLPVWAMQHPEPALDWAIANADRLDSGAVRSLAQQYAAGDAARPMDVLSRLPPHLHADWLDGAVVGLARHDPAAAAQSLTQLSSPGLHVQAAYVIAGEWARQDPAAAAAWVVEQGSDPSLASSFGQVAEVWARDAPDAARQWVLGLPAATARDHALDGLLPGMAASGALDTSVLAQYSSDEARQRAAMQVIVEIGTFDPRQAGRLIEQHLTDPMMRRLATDEIERRQQPGSGQFRGAPGGPR